MEQFIKISLSIIYSTLLIRKKAATILCLLALIPFVSLSHAASTIGYLPVPKKNEVHVVDIENHRVIKKITNVGVRPIVVKGLPDGSKVYVDNFGPFANDFTVIDTATNEVIKKIQTNGTPWAAMEMSTDGHYFYIPTTNSVVQVVDTSIDEIVATWNVGGLPSSILLNPNDTELYVFYADGTVEAYDTASGTVTKQKISVRGLGTGWAMSNPEGTKIYAINTVSDDVSVINVNSWSVDKIIKLGLGSFPISSTVKPGTHDLYVVNTGTFQAQSSISVIDMVSDVLIGKTDVLESSVHLSFNQDGSRAYLSTLGPASRDWSIFRFILHSLFYFIPTGDGSIIDYNTESRLPQRLSGVTLLSETPIAGHYYFDQGPTDPTDPAAPGDCPSDQTYYPSHECFSGDKFDWAVVRKWSSWFFGTTYYVDVRFDNMLPNTKVTLNAWTKVNGGKGVLVETNRYDSSYLENEQRNGSVTLRLHRNDRNNYVYEYCEEYPDNTKYCDPDILVY